jgi:glycine dehydrogenase subunit 1
MSFVPHDQADRKQMLDAIGIQDEEELFATIPAELRLAQRLKIPGPLDEENIRRIPQGKASTVCFAGGGIYLHHIPAVVDALAARQEFYTAYTPYQPEISQGTLQTIFEFQSMMASLTGMYVANASLYDGATALAEAALMAIRAKPIKRVLVTRATNPRYRAVLKTYLAHTGVQVQEIPFDMASGQVERFSLERLTGDDAALFVQNPNFFGVLEPMDQVAHFARQSAFWGIVVTEAVSLGLLKRPGDYGPDVVLGEAQSFGNPPNAGGPLLGFFCTTKEHLRRMPGRVVGLTQDTQGRQAFCLTLSTREQHIRREKATSNICTNQGLCSIRAALYLAAVGPKGLRDVATQCVAGAHQILQLLQQVGKQPVFKGPFFHEFVVQMDAEKRKALEDDGITPGVPIEYYYPEIKDGLLVAVTEMNTREEWKCLLENL